MVNSCMYCPEPGNRCPGKPKKSWKVILAAVVGGLGYYYVNREEKCVPLPPPGKKGKKKNK